MSLRGDSLPKLIYSYDLWASRLSEHKDIRIEAERRVEVAQELCVLLSDGEVCVWRASAQQMGRDQLLGRPHSVQVWEPHWSSS